MKKIMTYCTPAMLAALTELRRSGQTVPPPLWWSLKSRGWINNLGNITAQGVEYLDSRGIIAAQSN